MSPGLSKAVSGALQSVSEEDRAVRADFARLGVPVGQLPAMRPDAAAGGDMALATHLWPVVELASAMRTQLRAVAKGDGVLYLGLDYGPLQAIKRDLGLPRRGTAARKLLQHLRLMETEIIAALNTREAGA